MFTGYRLSLGIAWLVIVASEMLTGTPGVGGFLWQEYNSLIYAHILLAIITIGVIGFVLDRLMGLAEAQAAGGLSAVAVHRSRRASPSRSPRAAGVRPVLRDVSLVGRARRVRLDRRRDGQRQVDAAQHARRPDDAGRRHGHDRRRAGARRPARRRVRLPELLAAAVVHARSRTSGWRSRRRFPTLTRDEQQRARARRRSSRSGSATRSTAGRASCPAACASAWRSPARSRPSRDVLFLDEPFGALDALTRETLQQELARLCVDGERPVTTVMITNSVEEAILLSDRIVPMLPGPPATLGAPIPVRAAAAAQRWRSSRTTKQATHVRAHVVATLTAALGAAARRRRASARRRPRRRASLVAGGGDRDERSARADRADEGLPTRRRVRSSPSRTSTRRSTAGEFVAILGHSGCGKSTVLSIIAGLEQATLGGVVIDGTRGRSGPGAERAIVFQAPCLLPWLTARENVRLAAAQRPRTRRSARAARGRATATSTSSASATPPTSCRRSCRSARSSASRWRARCRSSRGSCCSTSRSRSSTR